MRARCQGLSGAGGTKASFGPPSPGVADYLRIEVNVKERVLLCNSTPAPPFVDSGKRWDPEIEKERVTFGLSGSSGLVLRRDKWNPYAQISQILEDRSISTMRCPPVFSHSHQEGQLPEGQLHKQIRFGFCNPSPSKARG